MCLQADNNHQINLGNTIAHVYIINMYGVKNNWKPQLTFNLEVS